jgi:hypothetical protein
VDGVRTVQAIIDSSGSGEFEVCRTLFDFLNRNLIAPAGRGATPALEEAVETARVSSTPGYLVAVLVLALAAAGLVAQSRSPFAVTGLASALQPYYDKIMDGVTRSRLARLDRALQAWQATHGAPPATLEDLVRAGIVDRSYLRDPWQRPFHYEPAPGGYLVSAVDEGLRARADATVDRRSGQ